MAQAGAALSDIGAVSVREDINLEPCFWGQFPGNESYLVRRALISTANAAGFLSLHGLPMGRASGNHWGDSVTVLETTASTPYFFNFHEGDLGHFSVIGPSGSGKTVILNFLACQAQRFAPRTVLFDKDRGAEIFIRAAGEVYSRLVPGEPSGLNPLQLPDTPINRAFVRDWLGVLLEAERRRRGGADRRGGRRLLRFRSARSGACDTSRSCSAARGGRSQATSRRACSRGSVRSMAGCSTMRKTGLTSMRGPPAST